MAILDHTAQLFFEHGYDLVSVDAIVARVGGSKSNIYRHFGDKEGLLEALVERECTAVRQPLDQLDLDGLPIERALLQMGKVFLSVIYDERAVALHRIVIAQGRRFPKLAAIFAASGPEGAAQAVATLFKRWQKAGLIEPSREPHLLARQFLDLLKIDAHARLLLGLDAEQSKRKRAHVIAEAVQTFLRGAAP